jgi:signal transduction histidine kinase
MLAPGERDGGDTGFSVAPSAGWRDRWRTVLWLEARLLLGWVTCGATVWLPVVAVDLGRAATGYEPADDPVVSLLEPHWACALLIPLPLLVLYGMVVGLGELVTALARRLLGPSVGERIAALEERTEQLLERNRIARELHDSIGHALTVAVVQAGAARAAGDPEFTARALAAVEETGRAALEDLERVLGVLREAERPVSGRPTLTDADRLLESARTSGAKVDAEVSGPVETVAGPVSREGYRILQEALTNVLRHAGSVPVRVRIEVRDGALSLEVRNPLPDGRSGSGRGSGLRGIRERAALLGGSARTGPHEGDWQVHAELPLH